MARGKSRKTTSKGTASSSRQVQKSTRSRTQASLPSSSQTSPPAVVSGNVKGNGRRSRVESSPPPPTSEQEDGSVQESEPEGGNLEENDSDESDRRNDGTTFRVYISFFFLFDSQSSFYSPGT